MIYRKHVVCFGGAVLLQCASLSLRGFSSSLCLNSPKKRSPYSFSDSERYSSLVKSVMSSRVSSQTPESLQEEDEHLYGRVIKAHTPSGGKERNEPKTFHPFSLHDKNPETEDPGHLLRIALKRNQARSVVPSVTHILQQTLSPEQVFLLDRWRKKMIADLGEDGFKEYSQNLFKQGRLFHSALDDLLTSAATQKDQRPPDVAEYPSDVQGYMQSIAHILEDVSGARALESAVRHDTLNYLGVVDCVARYRGVLCVIDWKTSEKQKPFLRNTYDNPVQVAAYAGALNNDGNYNYQVENGLIVVAYKDGSPGHAHQIDAELMQRYWNSWLLRLERFRELS